MTSLIPRLLVFAYFGEVIPILVAVFAGLACLVLDDYLSIDSLSAGDLEKLRGISGSKH